MFDLSFAEILLIVLVTIVFIGPKELPVVIKAIVKALRYVKSIAHEFRKMFDELADESGMKDIERDIKMIQGDDGTLYEAYDISKIEPKKSDDQA